MTTDTEDENEVLNPVGASEIESDHAEPPAASPVPVSLPERVVLIVLTLVNGAGMAVQAGVNVSVGSAMCSEEPGGDKQNTLGAGLISFIGGWLLLLVLNAGEIACQGEARCARPAKWWELTGGLLGSTVMSCTLVSTPTIGFALSAIMRIRTCVLCMRACKAVALVPACGMGAPAMQRPPGRRA